MNPPRSSRTVSARIEGSRKRPTNLSADAALLDEAKRLGLNLSRVFESALTHAVRQRRREAWLEANREALAAYDAHVARDGVFSDGLRSF